MTMKHQEKMIPTARHSEHSIKRDKKRAVQIAALQSAASMESIESAATFDGSSIFKYKGVQRPSAPSLGGASDYSSCESEEQQDWVSKGKDIDLTASEDILCDDEDHDDGHLNCSQTSSCSNFNEGAAYKQADASFLKRRESLEVQASYNEEPTQMTSSPTKSGHFIPRPVPSYCLVAKTAEQYGFTPFVISVGTSYFQRLASVDPALKKAAQGCPDFAPFVRDVPDMPRKVRKSVGAPLHQCQTAGHWLMAVHLTCIYVAAKNVEVVPYVHLLQTMLQCLHALIVTQDQAEALELEVLIALEWRLGPFFLHHRREQ